MGNEIGDLAGLDRTCLPVLVAHIRVLAAADGHGGGDRGQRQRTGGQQLRVEESIDQGALASLRLAKHEYPYPSSRARSAASRSWRLRFSGSSGSRMSRLSVNVAATVRPVTAFHLPCRRCQ